jgi:hypothetical protein
MNSANGKSEVRDELLDQIVVACLEAVERGHAPLLQDWLSPYPELVPRLTGFLADHEPACYLGQVPLYSRADNFGQVVE